MIFANAGPVHAGPDGFLPWVGRKLGILPAFGTYYGLDSNYSSILRPSCIAPYMFLLTYRSYACISDSEGYCASSMSSLKFFPVRIDPKMQCVSSAPGQIRQKWVVAGNFRSAKEHPENGFGSPQGRFLCLLRGIPWSSTSTIKSPIPGIENHLGSHQW